MTNIMNDQALGTITTKCIVKDKQIFLVLQFSVCSSFCC